LLPHNAFLLCLRIYRTLISFGIKLMVGTYRRYPVIAPTKGSHLQKSKNLGVSILMLLTLGTGLSPSLTYFVIRFLKRPL
jgi:hypothetical protein